MEQVTARELIILFGAMAVQAILFGLVLHFVFAGLVMQPQDRWKVILFGEDNSDLPNVRAHLQELKEDFRALLSSVRDDGCHTILLVQYKAGVREVMATILRERGYTVIEASNADEAEEVCASHRAPIHLLITDVEMPGLSGRALAERLGGGRPAMRVLYVSGYFDPARATVHRASQETGGVFAPELLTPQSLSRKVRDALGRAEGETALARGAGSQG